MKIHVSAGRFPAADPGRYAATTGKAAEVKFTEYFEEMQRCADRAAIRLEWVRQVVEDPVEDGETVHNAFFDRSFTP